MWRAVNSSDGEYSGHGAMDYVDDYRLMYCLRRGLPTDMNVYDAAVLSAVVELSERSVREGSRPVEFPDFTRGRWQQWEWPESSAFGEMSAKNTARATTKQASSD